MDDLRRRFDIADHAVDPAIFGMEIIIAQLEPNIEKYQETSRHPNGEPGDIEEGKCLVLPKMAEGSLQVVP
jgi:hypothetical protein